MKALQDFLGKFKRFTRKDEDLRKRVVEVCWDVAHISIPIECVSFRNRTIYLDIKPIERNEIVLYKEVILPRVRGDFPVHKIEDIR